MSEGEGDRSRGRGDEPLAPVPDDERLRRARDLGEELTQETAETKDPEEEQPG